MQNKQYGFTLIEVMLAITVTAVVALLAYQSLDAAITAAQRQEQQAERWSAIQLALTVLERDSRMIVDRSIIDGYGEQEPALIGGPQADYPLTLSRRGWSNPQGQRRSELQRIRYVLEDDTLWRDHWLVMDRINDEDGLQRLLLLDDVLDIQLRFLLPQSVDFTQEGEWVDSWGAAPYDQALPIAIEIVLTLDDVGQLRRMVELLPSL